MVNPEYDPGSANHNSPEEAIRLEVSSRTDDELWRHFGADKPPGVTTDILIIADGLRANGASSLEVDTFIRGATVANELERERATLDTFNKMVAGESDPDNLIETVTPIEKSRRFKPWRLWVGAAALWLARDKPPQTGPLD